MNYADGQRYEYGYVNEHWVGAVFDFDLTDLSLWKRANLSLPQRRGKTALLEEIRNMRALRQAITTTNVAMLNDITGQELWDAISETAVSSGHRAEIFNRIMNNRSIETLSVAVVSLDRDKYVGRTVDYLGKQGVLTDIGYLGTVNTYHFVIDGLIYGAARDQVLKILPDGDEQPKSRAPEADEWRRRVSNGFHYLGYMRAGHTEIYSTHKASWIAENIDELRGRFIQVRNSPCIHILNGRHINGVLDDARLTSKGSVTFVINGEICADDADAEVYLYEPEYCRTKHREIHEDGPRSCTKLRHHLGDHKF